MNRAQAKQMRICRSKGKVGVRTTVRVVDNFGELLSFDQSHLGKPVKFRDLPNHDSKYLPVLLFEGDHAPYHLNNPCTKNTVPEVVQQTFNRFSRDRTTYNPVRPNTNVTQVFLIPYHEVVA